MSNQMTLFKNGLPSFMKRGDLDETTKALMGSTGGGKRISIKGNVFRMIANGEEVAVNEDRAMNIVIVKALPGTQRTYYAGTYVEGENASPVCWSADGKMPDSKIPNPQCRNCNDCPQNIKGSGQGDSRACRFSRKLAVVLDGDMGGDVYQLALPAQSVFGKGEVDKLPLEAYVRLLGSHGVPVTGVVTEMRFDLKSPTPKLTFKAVRGLNDEEYEICSEQANSVEANDAIQHTFQIKEDKGEEFEQAKPKKAAPKPAPKPEPVAEDAEEIPEPVKASKKPAAEAPETSKEVADLIDEWSDD